MTEGRSSVNETTGPALPESFTLSRHSMYAIFTYTGVVSGVNVGIYTKHGVFGLIYIYRSIILQFGAAYC